MDEKAKGILVGIAAGSAIGAAAGLMFASKSGKELREDIARRGNELYEDTRRMVSDSQMKAKAAFDDVVEDARHRAEGLKKEAMSRLSEVHGMACEAMNCS